MLIAPALILIGLFMLFGHRLNLPNFGFSGRGERMGRGGGWGALLLGILFSLAFCPTSGVFYFGMLIPMSAAETGGYLLPAVFAVATGLPVVIVAWLLAYSVAGRILQPDAGDSKVALADCRLAFYSRGHLLWSNLFLLK